MRVYSILIAGLVLLFTSNHIPAATNVNSQRVDSLLIKLQGKVPDSTRCRIYLDIGDHYFSTNSDSAIKYLLQAQVIAQNKKLRTLESQALNRIGHMYRMQGKQELAIDSYLSAIEIDERLGDKLGVSKSYNNLGLINFELGYYERAIEFFEKSIEIKEALGDKKGLAGTHSNIGIVYRNQGSFEKAIEKFFESLRFLEEEKDLEGVSKCYLNIGNIHYNQGNYNKALEYYLRAMKISEEINDVRGLSRVYNNVGIIYRHQEKFSQAIEYYVKALSVFETLGDQNRIALALHNIGVVHRMSGSLNQAIDFFQRSLEIRLSIGDKKGVSSALSSLSECHIDISKLPDTSNQSFHLKKALDYAHKAYRVANEIGALPMVNQAVEKLKTVYTLMNRCDEALKYSNILLDVRDSLFNSDKAQALAEMQTKYDTEKKQQEIDNQRLVIERQEIENRRQRSQRNYSVAGAILLAFTVLIALRSYQQIRRSHVIISQKNSLLEQANEEVRATSEALSLQNEELRERNERILKQQEEIENQRNSLANLAWELQEKNQEVEQQKSLLVARNKEVTDSIMYAQRIQSAVLPSIHILKPYFTDYYILHKPKSIVSGDFYWATLVREWLIFCVADCTGHGVPGALMSMLGVAFLNEIVRKEEIKNSGMVLNELREYIVKSMIKQEEELVNYEGMDIGLCVYNTQTKILQFSGANLPCWIIPEKQDPLQPNENLHELSSQKMPIGLHEKMKPFGFEEYQICKGDRIYIATDGFADQIGGPEGKKIQMNGFKKLIVDSLHLSMSEQKKYFHNFFLDWQGENRQLDDVTVLCIQV